MARLLILEGAPRDQPVVLDRPNMVLGRHPDCEVVIQSGAVSRRHAQVVNRDGDFYVEDLQSRNGTYVNGQQIEGPRQLRDGDQVRICDYLVEFRDERTAAEKPRGGLSSRVSAIIVDDDTNQTQSSITGRLGLGSDGTLQQLTASADEKLQAFMELSKNLSRALALDDVLPPVLESLFRIFMQAESGFIVFQQADGSLLPMATRCRREEDSVRISRGIVNHVLSRKEAVLSANAADDSRFELTESIAQFQIRSFMCAPIVTPDGILLGAVQIDTRDPRRVFVDRDLEIMLAVASQASVSIQNAQLYEAALEQRALQRDLELAREVQQGLLPQRRPEVPGLEFYDYYHPAHHIGGDYYDYLVLPNGALAIVVADVAGHGISAALLMTKLAAEARFCLAATEQPALVLSRLNQLLCEDGVEDRFVTMALLVVDPSRGHIQIANAGHLPPMLRDGQQSPRHLATEAQGPPLGIISQYGYEQASVDFRAGDSIVLVTDGITEALNPDEEQYGWQRLEGAVAASCDTAEELGARVVAEVRRFARTQPQADDICVVCMRRVE